jgi:GMP reductase
VYPGDVSKAFGAGAHFVMLGGMLAGHKEGGGNIITKHTANGGAYKTPEGTYVPFYEEQNFVEFYGMSSDAAMATHGTRKDGYRGAEGKLVSIPYKGEVEATLTEVLGGVRSTCTYIGAKRIKDMPKCTTFVRCTQQVNQVFNQYNALS